MAYQSLADAFAGAELQPTPDPYDPTGKLDEKFDLEHAGMIDETGDSIIVPPYGKYVEPEPDPIPEPEPEPEPDPI